MGKTVALVIAVLLVLVFGATLFAIQTRHQREMTGIQQLLQKQEEELGILRADNAYLKSQTTEIAVLEEDLANKRTEIEGLKQRGEEQQEMIGSFEERLAELSHLQEQVDQLKQENDLLRLEAERKAVEGLESESLSSGEEPLLETAGEEEPPPLSKKGTKGSAARPSDESQKEEGLGEESLPEEEGETEALTFPNER